MPGKADIDRGLNERGISDLPKIAHYMKQHSYLPDQIYSSTSNRTRLTVEGIIDNIPGFNPALEFMNAMYSGSSDNYLSVIKSHQDNSQSLMLVGHNPTCDSLANNLIVDGNTTALETLYRKYPTGALAVIDLKEENWADVGAKTGYLLDFILPRSL